MLYAVIKETLGMKQFCKWHENYGDAYEEATRLCKKEQSSFIVIKALSRFELIDIPVRVTELT